MPTFSARSRRILFAAAAAVFAPVAAQAGTIVLYDQDFENPNGFINTSTQDASQQSVNSLYGNQPPGFLFAQQYTVETLYLSGTAAFGTGYTAPASAGDYLIGMLSTAQNDLLGLSFNLSGNQFLNLSIDLTSIDLSNLGGPFTILPPAAPEFRFTLFDNPSGAAGVGTGLTILDQTTASATSSARNVVDFTSVILALDGMNATNGNVILQVDLLTGGYAGFDNLLITSSDTAGDVGDVPVPAALPLFLSALTAFGLWRRRAR